ncbi:MAG: hypothetical protein AAGF94_04970 [Pseudomonadota bacterium]
MRRSILTLVTLTSLCQIGPALAQESWRLISDIDLVESEKDGIWRVDKTIPTALQDRAQDFSITGYAVPIMAQPYIQQFLLVEDPDDCPFCGDSGYGPSLEVTLRRSLPTLAEGTEVSVTGTLEFDMSPETYQTVRLKDAVITRSVEQAPHNN